MVPVSISMKSIEDLQQNPEDGNRPYRFFIPSYQRGYRWGEAEVSALMDDLSIFFDAQDAHRDRDYCLQPIVVKLQKDGSYEVIDGQQRLTTLLILLQYADPFMSNAFYSITYATRPHSQEFLHSLNANYSPTPELEDNPDFYYMALACKTIDKWTKTHGKDRPEMYCFLNSFRKHTKIIWYELPPSDANNDSIELFRKINVGKIPLTNAELVKGLLLSHNEFSIDTKRAIANEWDRLEHRLQDDALWCFLTNDIHDEYPTRIDLVLNIWLKNEDNATVIDHVHNPYAVFNYLYSTDHEQEEQDLLRDMWQKCKGIFANLEYWFQDRELYHLIGYLIARRKPGKNDLLNLYAELAKLDKSELHKYLRELIKEDIDPNRIAEAAYNSDRDYARNVLLLFNLLTLNRSTSSLMRFPFDRYKKELWDLEHVHATAGGPPTDKEVNRNDSQTASSESRKMFFKGVLELLTDVAKDSEKDSDEIRAVEDFLSNDNFDEQTCTDFWEQHHMSIENELGDQDSIDNMVLLSSRLNRGYRNASFIEKRRWIIDADRDTTFIPPCTKNVFLKYYTDNPKDFSLWSQEDREAYLNGPYGIIATLTSYLCNGEDEQ